MLKMLINQSECWERTALLKQVVSNNALYFTLSDAKHLSDISTDAHCVIAPGYRLIRVDNRACVNNDGFEIALLNDAESSIAYYNKVRTAIIPESSPRVVAQCFTWRTPDARHAAAVRMVTQSVFFKYIVERYDVILSDNPEAGEGRFFWHRQVSLAIDHGLRVSYPVSAGRLQSIPTQKALNSLVDQMWMEAHERKDTLVLISGAGRANESISIY